MHPHYAQNLAKKQVGGKAEIALLPSVETIEAIIDVAFWASLRQEETYTPRISLAFVAPTQVDMPPDPRTARSARITAFDPAGARRRAPRNSLVRVAPGWRSAASRP